MPIACMEDEHLENFINLQLAKADISVNCHSDERKRLLYGGRQMDAQAVAHLQRNIVTLLYPYFAEAWFRGLALVKAKERLSRIMDREGQLEDGFIPEAALRNANGRVLELEEDHGGW